MALSLLAFVPSTPVALADVVSSTTSLEDASDAQLNNIDLAVEALNGAYVEPGDTFSFNDVVGPRDADSGYVNAVNGRGVKAMGGGVSQVAATLYLALKQMDGIKYLEKKSYGDNFTGSYVDDGADAIITDYGAGTDFRFRNDNSDGISISISTTDTDIECSLALGGDSGDDSWDDESTDSGTLVGSAEIVLDGTDALYNNVGLAADAINGLILSPGDTFSFNDVVGARTEARGYESAINGRGVKVVGGGVAQVASALWLAVKDMDDVTVTDKSTYGDKYNQSYVDDPDDAILTDYTAGTDFSFRNDSDSEMTINTSVTDDTLTCEIYE
jgi:vancomycin resistance protein YoaR